MLATRGYREYKIMRLGGNRYPEKRSCNTSLEFPALASGHIQVAVQDFDLRLYKSLHGTAPRYLEELVVAYQPTRSLRSESETLLTVPRTCRSHMVTDDSERLQQPYGINFLRTSGSVQH